MKSTFTFVQNQVKCFGCCDALDLQKSSLLGLSGLALLGCTELSNGILFAGLLLLLPGG